MYIYIYIYIYICYPCEVYQDTLWALKGGASVEDVGLYKQGKTLQNQQKLGLTKIVQVNKDVSLLRGGRCACVRT